MKDIIVVGGGLAGLMATLRLGEKGYRIKLFSIVPVKRSHSVCAQGGINAAINAKGEGDSPWLHFYETIYGGDFIANQVPVLGMAELAPKIVYLFDRMGVPFNRTPEGTIDFRRFGGTLFHRTAFAGATTGQQLLYALDEQVRKLEVDQKVVKYEPYQLMKLIISDDGVCRGVVVMNLYNGEIEAHIADAVILATGGLGYMFKENTNSIINTGSAGSIAYQQGVYFANPEFIQVHPTAMKGYDKNRLISESVRGEGGRVWAYDANGRKVYFLEEWYPGYGNLVPRDIASRAIFKAVHELGYHTAEGEPMVYLDITELVKQRGKDYVKSKLGGVLEIYEKFTGVDPYNNPMKIFPAVHYSMGGLWVDYDQMTNVPGLFAIGEQDYQYHGANRLGANSLLSCLYAGYIMPNIIDNYVKQVSRDYDEQKLIKKYVDEVKDELNKIRNLRGNINPYKLADEFRTVMSKYVTVIRNHEGLVYAYNFVKEALNRYNDINIYDSENYYANTTVSYVKQLKDMMILALAIIKGALKRKESRGAHYRTDYEKRDDDNYLKTTKAKFNPNTLEPEISYEEVDTRLIPPQEREYKSSHKEKIAKALKLYEQAKPTIEKLNIYANFV
jgi:succinate dehydrogenase / fumarate reductase flavoprotein subunit